MEDGDLRGIWKSGFCNCCESTTDCCIGFFVPCVEAGIAADKAGYGSLWAALQCLFYPLLVPVLRYQVRHEQRIDGNCFNDLISGWCCPCCAAIQIKREFDCD